MAPVALITGAAGGIGGAALQRFVAGGWMVAAVDLNEVAGDNDVLSIRADLADVAHCRRAVAEAVEWAGRLDAVVNAAGVWTEGASADTTEAEWDRVVDLNLKGLYFVSSAAIPHLTSTRGCIVNMSSDAGVQGNAGAAVYCASKGGVTNLTRAIALEVAGAGITVNAVSPGWISTGAQLIGEHSAGKYTPLGRSGTPDEVAAAVRFLADPTASFITAQQLVVDGGNSLPEDRSWRPSH